MKKIFLIGDSIRYGAYACTPKSPGYGVFVKEKLQNKAIVYAPNENCRFTQYTLRYLHEWANDVPNKEEIDLVHWNNGLWDVLRLFGDEPFTEINYYGETLKRIYRRIRLLFPNAKIIFALSTSVKEEWGHKEFFRIIEKLNYTIKKHSIKVSQTKQFSHCYIHNTSKKY